MMRWILRVVGSVGIVPIVLLVWPILLGAWLLDRYDIKPNNDLLVFIGGFLITVAVAFAWYLLLVYAFIL